MIAQGRVLCNGCSRYMGTFFVPTDKHHHFCPDCTDGVDILTPALSAALSDLVTVGIKRGIVHKVLR